MRTIEPFEDKPSRVAIVTGGRRGLGAAIAKALGAAGFDIAIADLVCNDDANETLQAIQSEGRRVAFFEADIADIDQHDACWIRCRRPWVPLHASSITPESAWRREAICWT